jgi:para-nitrobenzyl esterase
MKYSFCIFAILVFGAVRSSAQDSSTLAQTPNGTLQGITGASGIRMFKGIAYAQPPIGGLRWREPQPVSAWKGIRKAVAFGPRAMQLPIYADMQFRSNGVSEDCLYLNVWTPGKTSGHGLPVLVYFYGGGFNAGDGSEYRYDGENLATKGIVTVTVNYRLGIFGFLSHPELTKESEHHASGNYGLLDQHAALVWVQQNIAAFGGDPKRVTIAGESAGSFSVSAQMASPLSKGLFAGAIGESGSMLGGKTLSLADAEKNGAAFAAGLGNKSLADLRAMAASDILAVAAKGARFSTNIDGYFLPESPVAIFAAGKQMPVALLAGWNSAEQNYTSLLGHDSVTVANYEKAVVGWYHERANAVLAQYKAGSTDEIKQQGTDLATDRFIAFGTWKWIDLHSKTSNKPVYRYLYAHPRPVETGSPAGTLPPVGAGHSWEIEYALGNLKTNTVYSWTPDDYKVSETMEAFFANFIKNGDPNGPSLPTWSPLRAGSPSIMVIDVVSHPATAQHDDRYRFLDTLH